MKRLLILVSLFVVTMASSAMAQESECGETTVQKGKNINTIRYKHDIRITYGAPGFLSLMWLDDADLSKPPQLTLPDNLDPNSIKTGPQHIFMTLGAGYNYQLTPLISLGAKATFATIWQDCYDKVTNDKVYVNRQYNLSLLADARFSWLRREKVELYSSLSFGVMTHIAPKKVEYTPMFDVALIGVTFGRSLYGFVEVGGLVGGSARAGIGYRFGTKK